MLPFNLSPKPQNGTVPSLKLSEELINNRPNKPQPTGHTSFRIDDILINSKEQLDNHLKHDSSQNVINQLADKEINLFKHQQQQQQQQQQLVMNKLSAIYDLTNNYAPSYISNNKSTSINNNSQMSSYNAYSSGSSNLSNNSLLTTLASLSSNQSLPHVESSLTSSLKQHLQASSHNIEQFLKSLNNEVDLFQG